MTRDGSRPLCTSGAPKSFRGFRFRKGQAKLPAIRPERRRIPLHGTREVGEHAVPCRVGDPAAMLRNKAVHNLTAAAKARKVPASSWLIRREYPATSAAASRRSTLCSFGGCTGPPVGNRAPGAVKVQAALSPGRRCAAMAPRDVKPRSSRVIDAHRHLHPRRAPRPSVRDSHR
jgi:hypothetical protein